MTGLRRSLHFVPASNARMFEKALTLPADALILDLEDSVTPQGKRGAREQACQWLREFDWGGRERLLRINPLNSEWGSEDLEAALQCPLDAIVVPKVAGPDDVQALNERLVALESERDPVPLILIATELPAAVFALQPMAGHPRVAGLAWGAEDLSAALGAPAIRGRDGELLEVFRVVRSLTLLAAVAGDAQPIDAPFVDIHDESGLRRDCEQAAAMGFTGKLTIHPSQIEIVNQAFTPAQQEVERAMALVRAFQAQQAEGRMAFSFEGAMVDAAHLKRARSVLRRAGVELSDD